MLSVAEARAKVLAGLAPTGPEIVSLVEATGRVAAAAVEARLDQPASDISAMDGWALRAADGTAGAVLRIAARAPAGHPTAVAVGPGEAIRVFTGSAIPAGADTVLLQENATETGDTVRVDEPARPGQHIRARGGDFRRGLAVVAAGERLGARAIGLAAGAGHPWLAVRRRPRVALLATGDEIVLPGEPIPAGGLPGSNSFSLASLVRHAGGEPLILPVAPDDLDAIAAAAQDAAACDLLVTIGGASVGDHDLVRPALGRFGFVPDVSRIAMRPGKPLTHGHLVFGDRRVPVLGLPGNPVSALVCGLLFLRPAVEALLGLAAHELPRRRAILAAAVRANDARADHLRASIARDPAGGLVATPFPIQDSARLRDFARADALVLRPPHAEAGAPGDPVDVLLLDELGV